MTMMPDTRMNAHIRVDTMARSVRSNKKNMEGSRNTKRSCKKAENKRTNCEATPPDSGRRVTKIVVAVNVKPHNNTKIVIKLDLCLT